MLYMVTFTINISPMLEYIPYMDPMGLGCSFLLSSCSLFRARGPSDSETVSEATANDFHPAPR